MEIETIKDKETEAMKLVVPPVIRDRFQIKDGDKFLAVEDDGKLILVKVWFNTNSNEDIQFMRRMMATCQAHAEEHDLTEKDMWDAIAKVRAVKKKTIELQE